MRSASFDRAEVIEKITDAFWENGYEATSIGILEGATGLKRQSLYNTFGNKDAMFEIAIAHYEAEVSMDLLDAFSDDDPLTAIATFFATQAATLLDPSRPSGCLVAGAQQELANRDGELGERMSGLTEEQYDTLVAAFERWRDAGKLTEDADPEDVAAIMMAQMRGQSVLGRSSRGRALIERSARAMPALFERYLA
ncbi:MAG: TetR/AcrR family transcriptional regulator [Pseudomonadota bacterium]